MLKTKSIHKNSFGKEIVIQSIFSSIGLFGLLFMILFGFQWIFTFSFLVSTIFMGIHFPKFDNSN